MPIFHTHTQKTLRVNCLDEHIEWSLDNAVTPFYTRTSASSAPLERKFIYSLLTFALENSSGPLIGRTRNSKLSFCNIRRRYQKDTGDKAECFCA